MDIRAVTDGNTQMDSTRRVDLTGHGMAGHGRAQGFLPRALLPLFVGPEHFCLLGGTSVTVGG